MDSLISVIIPIYQVEKYLDCCITSVIHQTYSNLQIILVDDGSLDQCGEICDKYSREDVRITVIHKKNGGLSDARNAGLEIAKGEYIYFLDSDDYISPRLIEKLYTAMKKSDSDLAICGIQRVDENGVNISTQNTLNMISSNWTESDFWEHYFNGLGEFCVVAWNKLYKRKLFSNIRYDVGKLHEDAFLLDRIIQQCRSIQIVSDKLYFYRQRSSSIMGQSFSVKRLDGVEARLVRCERFIKRHKMNWAFSTLKETMTFLLTSHEKLDLSILENALRYKELKKYFRRIYFKLIWHRMPLKLFLSCMLFLISENVFVFVSRLKKSTKKRGNHEHC